MARSHERSAELVWPPSPTLAAAMLHDDRSGRRRTTTTKRRGLHAAQAHAWGQRGARRDCVGAVPYGGEHGVARAPLSRTQPKEERGGDAVQRSRLS